MKKIIIAAISAIAVMSSVIGCQIYDSQTNKVLASAMNKNGQDIFKLQDYFEKFNNACVVFRDNTSDVDSYNTIVDMYMGFDKFKKSASATVATIINELDDATSDKNEHRHDDEYILSTYKEQYLTPNKLYGFLYDGLCKLYVTLNGEFKPNDKDSAAAQAEARAKYLEEQAKFAREYKDFSSVTIIADVKSGDSYTLADLYENVYKLQWDYNSKK